jgi:hypothetical protein
MKNRSGRKPTHGQSNTRLYYIWRGMKARCKYMQPRYHRYSGRGISVCDEWQRSFVAFLDWAIANGYRDDLLLDRRDNDGNYEPRNCRWATPKQQARNRGNNRILLAFGEKKSVTEWLEDHRCGLTRKALVNRLIRIGDTSGDMTFVFQRPLVPHEIKVSAFGESKSLSAWSRDPRCAVKFETFVYRINRGVEPEVALTLPPDSGRKHVLAST